MVSVVSSFLYEDGKMLNGTGTLASKSRLPGVEEARLECLSNRQAIRKEDKNKLLLQGREKKRVEGDD